MLPLLPRVERRARRPGRKRHPDRLVFQGVLSARYTGIQREHLSEELGFGSGMTCRRRRRTVTRSGSGSGCTRCGWPS
ncbi:transposase [Streptomyces sp. NPDC056749]|uniref:transposase n=1 Tax=Streptomyces sp. NPDC056749 TaxID=3345936 RepID=UPI003689CE72